MKLVLGHLYPEYLNLYDDNGNVEVLKYRARKRGIDVEVIDISLSSNKSNVFDGINLLFMGGGPDSCQNAVYLDFLKHKKDFLEEYIYRNKVGLFICGAYQLLGHYYKGSDGTMMDGLDILDLYTEHPGESKARCIGNVEVTLSENIRNETLFAKFNRLDASLVGFENHGGRTYLGVGVRPLGIVKKGFGNNQTDKTEGAVFKNCFGTYLHGPLLSKNPHFADYLLSKALGDIELLPLDDKLETTVHTASKMLKQ